MAQSKTEICNIARAHLGFGKTITNVDTETTPEALQLQMFWDYAVRSVLRDFDWPFAKKTIALSQVATSPTDLWKFSYRYPADCVKARRIQSNLRTDTTASRIPFEETTDVNGTLIYTDAMSAKLEYTTMVTSVMLYPPDMCIALSFLLASMIAPSVERGEAFKLGDRCLQMYRMWRANAAANAQNEIQGEQAADAESIRARG